MAAASESSDGGQVGTDLGPLVAAPKTGLEQVTREGRPIGATVQGFWRWAFSDLISNATRGVFAEYLVGLALGCVDGGTRLEWDACDLRTATGMRVEVKSAAYLQSWRQERLSAVSFDIRPSTGWDAATNITAAERRRQADVYVFCLLRHVDKASVDPLNLDQWTFYVLATRVLNEQAGEQKRISLSRLSALGPATVGFDGLRDAVHVAAAG
jgi:hypothetical protein